MSSGYAVLIQKRAKAPLQLWKTTRSSSSATIIADREYLAQALDTVIVTEVDLSSSLVSVIYKRERKCKHTNIQLTLLEDNRVVAVCDCCGLKFKEDIVNEER